MVNAELDCPMRFTLTEYSNEYRVIEMRWRAIQNSGPEYVMRDPFKRRTWHMSLSAVNIAKNKRLLWFQHSTFSTYSYKAEFGNMIEHWRDIKHETR